MSKKTTSGITASSTSPPKTSMAGNSSYGPTFRWQSSFLPPPMGQLALPPPTTVTASLWTPIGAPLTQGFGYGFPYGQPVRPTFGPPPGVGSHTNHCCLAGQRHQCQVFDHNCNGWPNNSSNVCWHNNPRDSDNHLNSASNGVAISELDRDESEDESTDGTENSNDSKSRKTIKSLKSRNEDLKSDLEDIREEMKNFKEKHLNIQEKSAFDYIEKFQTNLKKYGDFIRQEANRFYTNESMSKKLQPIVEQLTTASAQAKEEKEKIRQSVATARQQLKDDKDIDFDKFSLSSISLPDLPDLMSFYKNILDGIPPIFLSDMSQLKNLANDMIQMKNKIPVSNALSLGLPFGDEPNLSLKTVHSLPSVATSLFAVPPKVSELPKPDFNTLPLKPSPEPSAPPALELSFPPCQFTNPSPIPMPHSISEDEASSQPLLDLMTPSDIKERSLSPIGKPVQQLPVIDLKDIFAKNLRNGSQNSLSAIGESLRQKPEPKLETDAIRAPFNPVPPFMKSLTKPITATVKPPSPLTATSLLGAVPSPSATPPPPKPVLNQAQTRLLMKLKEKYQNLSDEQLTESMSKTKAEIIAAGNPKGFTGMKVADIINRISDYIDKTYQTKVFMRPKLVELKSTTNETNTMFSTEELPKFPSAPKSWKNPINPTSGSFDKSTCSICFEQISHFTRYETECHHFFHNTCISNWIKSEGSCPICRCHVLPPEEFPHLS